MGDGRLAFWQGRGAGVNWGAPVQVTVPAAVVGPEKGELFSITRWCCRICIADRGLSGALIREVDFCFDRGEKADKHIRQVHGPASE
jgi:hypothetical protein